MMEAPKSFEERWAHIAQQLNAWAQQVLQDMQPVLQALVAAMPKQKIVDRRKLAQRRSRRRSERKIIRRA